MVDIINDLYNLTIFLLFGSLFVSVAVVGYIIGIIKCAKNVWFLLKN